MLFTKREKTAGEAIASMWARAGIRAKIQIWELGALAERRRKKTLPDGVTISSHISTPSGMYYYFRKNQLYTCMNDDKLNELTLKMCTFPEGPDQNEFIKNEMCAYIADLMPGIPLVLPRLMHGVRDEIDTDAWEKIGARHVNNIPAAEYIKPKTGPYRDYKSSELVLNGFHSMINNGLPDRHPLKKGGHACLYQGGLIAALATLGALWASEERGIGQYIDVSLMETQAGDADRKNVDLLAWAYSGNAIYTMRPRADDWKGRHIMPSGIFPCKDGFISSRPILAHWPRFVELMKRPELEKIRFPDDMFDMDMKGEIEVIRTHLCPYDIPLPSWEKITTMSLETS